MARGVNKAIIIGALGVDPEVRYMPSGAAVANLSVATNEMWKDKQTGQPQERTEWHRVALFGRLAEVAGDCLRKGSKVYIEGRLQTRKWQGQDGQDRYTTQIVANDMQMLDGRGGHQGSAPAAPTNPLPPETPAVAPRGMTTSPSPPPGAAADAAPGNDEGKRHE